MYLYQRRRNLLFRYFYISAFCSLTGRPTEKYLENKCSYVRRVSKKNLDLYLNYSLRKSRFPLNLADTKNLYETGIYHNCMQLYNMILILILCVRFYIIIGKIFNILPNCFLTFQSFIQFIKSVVQFHYIFTLFYVNTN